MRHFKTSKSEDVCVCSSLGKCQKKRKWSACMICCLNKQIILLLLLSELLLFHNICSERSIMDYLLYKLRCAFIYLHCTQILQIPVFYFSSRESAVILLLLRHILTGADDEQREGVCFEWDFILCFRGGRVWRRRLVAPAKEKEQKKSYHFFFCLFFCKIHKHRYAFSQ